MLFSGWCYFTVPSQVLVVLPVQLRIRLVQLWVRVSSVRLHVTVALTFGHDGRTWLCYESCFARLLPMYLCVAAFPIRRCTCVFSHGIVQRHARHPFPVLLRSVRAMPYCRLNSSRGVPCYFQISSRGGYGMSSMFGPSTAKLSHDHQTQYTFVTQSLRLWSEAMRNMYR